MHCLSFSRLQCLSLPKRCFQCLPHLCSTQLQCRSCPLKFSTRASSCIAAVTLQEKWQTVAATSGLPQQNKPLDSGLYLVATPIGNLEDISLRALRILQHAELVLAEDTRHSRKLLDYFGIQAAMQSLHEHNERAQQSKILSMLSRGAAIALISDAGMPLISDPGGDLVKAAIDAEHKVIPIPGPSAVLTALIASGLPASEFMFVGFLPPKQNARLKKLQQLSAVQATLLLYAPPHSLAAILTDAVEVLDGGRQCVVARELTKMHEEFFRGTLGEAAEEFQSRAAKGEITLVIEGAGPIDTTEDANSALRELIQSGIAPSQAVAKVVKDFSVKKSSIYQLALDIKAEMQ